LSFLMCSVYGWEILEPVSTLSSGGLDEEFSGA
jgi:hypothetical protein